MYVAILCKKIVIKQNMYFSIIYFDISAHSITDSTIDLI